MTKDEALKLALDALEESTDTERTYESFERGDIAITAIKDVLAQPEQEPVAKYIGECSEGSLVQLYDDVKKGTPLYASPPKRELESTADMMMELADRLGELPDDVDPRAWEHLLVYAPKPDLTDADRKTYQAGHNAGVAHHKQAVKREWVGLTTADIDDITLICIGKVAAMLMTEAKLKEKNHD